MQTSAHGTPAAAKAPRTCRKHTPATARIQARLEKWELEHLRELAAAQAERIEDLERQLAYETDQADFWRESHHRLEEHLNDGTEDARCIGLTVSGELLVVRTDADSQAAAPQEAPAPAYYPHRAWWERTCITGMQAPPLDLLREEFAHEGRLFGVAGLDAPDRIPRGGMTGMVLAPGGVWAEWTVDRFQGYWS